jgi:hypothetical protein
MKSIKIENGIHEWLLDHRDSKHKNISAVIKGLVDDSVAIQLLGVKLEAKNKEVE